MAPQGGVRRKGGKAKCTVIVVVPDEAEVLLSIEAAKTTKK